MGVVYRSGLVCHAGVDSFLICPDSGVFICVFLAAVWKFELS